MRDHLIRIFDKLGLSSRVELVLFSRRKLIGPQQLFRFCLTIIANPSFFYVGANRSCFGGVARQSSKILLDEIENFALTASPVSLDLAPGCE